MLLANTYITANWADTITFVEPYSNTINYVVDEKIIPHYKLNATKYFIPKEFLKKCQNITPPLSPNSANLLDYITKNFFFCLVRFYENRKFLYAFTPFKATSVLYNKSEKKITTFSQLNQENSWQTFFPPNHLRESTLYSAIDPMQLFQLIGETSDNCSEMRADSIKFILKNVKPTDNPLILGYEINKK